MAASTQSIDGSTKVAEQRELPGVCQRKHRHLPDGSRRSAACKALHWTVLLLNEDAAGTSTQVVICCAPCVTIKNETSPSRDIQTGSP